MAYFIKVIDTNFIEHVHFIENLDCVLIDINNSGKFSSTLEEHIISELDD